MQDFPHHYVATATARRGSNIDIASPGLETLESAGPPEFGGPGDLWSPETLLVATVADCLVLTFRAIARAARLEWDSIGCDVVGELNRVDKVTRFTGFKIRATLDVANGTSEEKARQLLEKAEKHCLVTNSMIADSQLEIEVRVGGEAADSADRGNPVLA